jgi:phosphoglycolate phosphatase-like HAD superfamily hydrolase
VTFEALLRDLDELRQALPASRWALVTNKPQSLTEAPLAAPERCIHVGDSPRHVQAARAARMAALVAAYGYIHPGEPIEYWGADVLIRHPADLPAPIMALEAQWSE